MTAKERVAAEDLARALNEMTGAGDDWWRGYGRRLRPTDAPELLDELKKAGFALAH